MVSRWHESIDEVALTEQEAVALSRSSVPSLSDSNAIYFEEAIKSAKKEAEIAIQQAMDYERLQREGAGCGVFLLDAARLLREAAEYYGQVAGEMEEAQTKQTAMLWYKEELLACFVRLGNIKPSFAQTYGQSVKTYINPEFMLAAKEYKQVLGWVIELNQETISAITAAEHFTAQAGVLKEHSVLAFTASRGKP
jgi:hypothetical protein